MTPGDTLRASINVLIGQIGVAIITAGVSIFAAFWQFAAVQRTIWQKANEEELKALQKSLDEFYGPFLHLSESSFLLAQDLRYRLNDPNYRMLLYLLKDGWLESLSIGDRVIVDEVCKNGARLEKLIYDHAGVTDDELLKYLGRASIHFRMLSNAYERKLGSDAKTFAPYVFPNHLTEVVKLYAHNIEMRCKQLREHPEKVPPSKEPLKIPKEWSLPEWPNPTRPAQPSALDRPQSLPAAGENNCATKGRVEPETRVDRESPNT